MTMTQPLPAFSTVPDWVNISGVSRSQTYKLLAAGKLRARKLGARTLVDVRHGLDYLNTLPPLHPAQQAAA
jgi:hypothetical protein